MNNGPLSASAKAQNKFKQSYVNSTNNRTPNYSVVGNANYIPSSQLHMSQDHGAQMDLVGYENINDDILMKDNIFVNNHLDVHTDRRLGGYNQSTFSASVPRGNDGFVDQIRYNSGNHNHLGYGANSASRSALDCNPPNYGYQGPRSGNFQIDDRNG